jgi:hypothetical protein
MGSTNRGRLTRAVTDGRATRVVIRLGVAIELVTGLTLLIIPGMVIRALIGADEGTTSTIVGRVLGGALVALGIAGASGGIRTPERPIVLAYVVYNVSTATDSRGRQCRWHSKRDPALAGGCSARASGFGSPRRPVTRSAVT